VSTLPVEVAQNADLGAVVNVVADRRPEDLPYRPLLAPVGQAQFVKVIVLQRSESLLLWFVPRKGDDTSGGRPERLAIFVGLWPLTLFLMGHALAEEERAAALLEA
jgi:hypothetical protein